MKEKKTAYEKGDTVLFEWCDCDKGTIILIGEIITIIIIGCPHMATIKVSESDHTWYADVLLSDIVDEIK